MVITEHKVHLFHLHLNQLPSDWLWCFLSIMKLQKHLTPLLVTKYLLCFPSVFTFYPVNLHDLCTPEAEIRWPTKTLDTSTVLPNLIHFPLFGHSKSEALCNMPVFKARDPCRRARATPHQLLVTVHSKIFSDSSHEGATSSILSNDTYAHITWQNIKYKHITLSTHISY